MSDIEEGQANPARQEAELQQALAQAEERLAALKAQTAAQEQHLADALDRANAELDACRARFAERQHVLEDIGRAVERTKQWATQQRTPAAVQPAPPTTNNDVEWNALRDTRYSRAIPGLDDILHVFHKEWFGIRAAVGSLPGDKAAITSTAAMPPRKIDDLYQRILAKNYKKIVFHGHSRNSSMIIEFLAARGLSSSIYLVKHGNPAQWHYKGERDAFFDAMSHVKAGRVRKIHIMRAGFEFPGQDTFKPLLLNLSPKIEPRKLELGQGGHLDQGVVFAPGWSDWRKNLYAGVTAASLSSKVRRIWIYANDFSAPAEIMSKVDIQPYESREQTFDLISLSSICMNASLLDCHPMVNLEAQALGRACIRGPLHLDALEDHPYVRLTNVADVVSISQIKATVDKVLSAPPAELEALIRDYQEQSDSVARSRYLEFLEM